MDTGEKWEHITYDSFRQGRLPIVLHKELKKKHTIGEKSIANNGQEMELLDYIDSRNVTVRFDDGTVVYNKAYSAFKRGNIGNPSKPLRGMYSGFESAADKRIGEKTVAHNGQEMEIIAYRHFNDIDVKFEDGTIVTNKNYQWFRKGYIRNPNYKKKE
jgi:hypothetical protein